MSIFRFESKWKTKPASRFVKKSLDADLFIPLTSGFRDIVGGIKFSPAAGAKIARNSLQITAGATGYAEAANSVVTGYPFSFVTMWTPTNATDTVYPFTLADASSADPMFGMDITGGKYRFFYRFLSFTSDSSVIAATKETVITVSVYRSNTSRDFYVYDKHGNLLEKLTTGATSVAYNADIDVINIGRIGDASPTLSGQDFTLHFASIFNRDLSDLDADKIADYLSYFYDPKVEYMPQALVTAGGTTSPWYYYAQH